MRHRNKMPKCNIHGTEMKKGSRNYFCPKKDRATGEWCSFELPLNTPATNEHPDWDLIAIGKTASLFMAAILQKTGDPVTARDYVKEVIVLAEDIVSLTSGRK